MSGAAAHAEAGHGHEDDVVLKGMKWLNESSGKFVDGAIGGPIRATKRAVGATLGLVGREKDYLVKNTFGLTPNPDNGWIENLSDVVDVIGTTVGGGEVAKLDAHHKPVMDSHGNPVVEYKNGWLEYAAAVPTMITTGALGALGEKLDHVPLANITVAPLFNAANWVGQKIGGGFGPKLDEHGHPVTEPKKDSHNHVVNDAAGHPIMVPVKEFKRGLAQRAINAVFFPFRMVPGFGYGAAKAIGSIPGLAGLSKGIGAIGKGSVYNYKEGKYGVSDEHHDQPPAAGGAAHPPAGHP